MITDLKPGDEVLLHTETYLREKYTLDRYRELVYTTGVKELLGTKVTITSKHAGHEDWYVVKVGKLSHTIELCMIQEKITQNNERETTMKQENLAEFEKALLQYLDIPVFAPSRYTTNTIMRAMAPIKSSKTKHLTLNITDGQANVKEMIHQAYFADIEDPRPFIQNMIKRELIRLYTYLETLTVVPNLGFNLKLRGLYTLLIELLDSKKPHELSMEDAVKIYDFQKLHAKYNATLEANDGVCPYQWIEAHLTHDNLNSTKTVELFISNKIQIFIKNGYLKYRENTDKAEHSYTLEIKFSVAENKFSL